MAVRPWIRRVLHPIVAYFAILGRASSCGLSQHLHTGALLGHSDYRCEQHPTNFIPSGVEGPAVSQPWHDPLHAVILRKRGPLLAKDRFSEFWHLSRTNIQ